MHIVEYNGNWVDEFDFTAMKIVDEADYILLYNACENGSIINEIYIGTNQEIDVDCSELIFHQEINIPEHLLEKYIKDSFGLIDTIIMRLENNE